MMRLLTATLAPGESSTILGEGVAVAAPGSATSTTGTCCVYAVCVYAQVNSAVTAKRHADGRVAGVD